MPPVDLPQPALQRHPVQRTVQPEGRRHRIGGGVAVQLRQEPEPLLGERQRQLAAVRHGLDRRQRLPGTGVDLAREPCHRRSLEETPHRQVDVEGPAHARHDPGREQRVSAELEEVVVDADPIDADHVTPDPREQVLGRRARGHGSPFPSCGGLGLGQCAQVDLPARGERQRVEQREGGGHHVVRQLCLQEGSQVGDGDGRAGVHGHIRIEPATRHVSPDGHGGVAHGGMLRQPCFDLANLDAEAADLDLLIDASKELDVAIGQVPGQVAGPVQTTGAEGIRHEPLGRERRLVQIASRQSGTADVDLAWNTDRHRLPRTIEQVDLPIRQRPADRHRRGLRRHTGIRPLRLRRVDRAGDGRLGRAVGVPPGHVRADARLPGGQRFLRHGLAAYYDHPHAVGQRAGRELGAPREPVRRRDVQQRHPLAHGQRLHLRDRRHHLVRAQDDPRAPHQPGKDVLDRLIEAERGEHQHAIVRRQPVFLVDGEAVIDEGFVRDQDALGLAGRARRVDAVGQVLRTDAAVRIARIAAGRTFESRPVVIQCHGGRAVREPRPKAGLRHHERHARVVEHELHAVARMRRVDRHVGAAGLQDAQQSGQRVARALHAEADEHLGPDLPLAEGVRDDVRPPVQLAVGEPIVAARDGDGVGGSLDLRLEQRVDAGIARIVDRRAVPVDERLPALFLGQPRQLEHRTVGLRRQSLEQYPEVAGHPPDRRLVEEIGPVPPSSSAGPPRSPGRSASDRTSTSGAADPSARSGCLPGRLDPDRCSRARTSPGTADCVRGCARAARLRRPARTGSFRAGRRRAPPGGPVRARRGTSGCPTGRGAARGC